MTVKRAVAALLAAKDAPADLGEALDEALAAAADRATAGWNGGDERQLERAAERERAAKDAVRARATALAADAARWQALAPIIAKIRALAIEDKTASPARSAAIPDEALDLLLELGSAAYRAYREAFPHD